jgi:thiosulfate/3-mercaptopyruvate sulfurtransferase
MPVTDHLAGPLPAAASGPLVGARWLSDHLAEVVVLDATVEMPSPRADGDYQVASGRSGWLAEHIPGSRHADLVSDLIDHSARYHFAHLPPQELAAALQRSGVSPGRPVVVYDQADCLWAARLWWELRAAGMRAQVLNGGLTAWKSAGLPTASGGDTPAPPAAASAASAASAGSAASAASAASAGSAAQAAQADPPTQAAPAAQADPAGTAPSSAPRQLNGAWADREDVLTAVRGQSPAILVCALAQDVYSGRTATRYTRRGHIPASVNLPARALLDEDGLLLEPAALSAAIRHVLALDGSPIIAYCGGGISAALLALGLTVLGVRDVSIYDGSLEEWTADPALPMEVTA